MSKMKLAELEELEEEDFERSRRPKRAKYQGRPIDEPAGPRRREALARVHDEQEEEQDGTEVPLKKLKDIKIDGEIISKFNQGDVPNADPNFVYKWSRFVPPYGGIAPVQYDLSMTIKTVSHGMLKCWETVKRGMPEAEGFDIAVDNTIKVGDVMLIRCRKDVYAAIMRWEAEKRRLREQGPANSLQSLGDRTGIPVRVSDIAVSPRGLDDPTMQRALKHASANEIASRQLDAQIKEGRVKGMEV